MKRLCIENLEFKFASDAQPLFANFSLDIAPGERVALIGASGVGKTTLLNLVAGFYKPRSGTISLDGEKLDGPDKRRGVMFQHPVYFPWASVLENIAYGDLYQSNAPRNSTFEKAEELLRNVGLLGHGHKYPHQLSGGMQKRLEIAQILMGNPQVVCMDEPFAGLDPVMRANLRQWLRAVVIDRKITALFATHELDDAVHFSNRIIVLGGHPVQIILDTRLEDASRSEEDDLRTMLELKEFLTRNA